MNDSKRAERAVDSIARIYAVVIALALSESVKTLITKDSQGNPELDSKVFYAIPALVGFIVTLVPFWHGMNRHLDRCYLEKKDGVAHGALLLDFAVFFIEASLFLLAGWAVRSNLLTFYCLGAILAIDSMWAFTAHWIHHPKEKSHSFKWCIINFVALAISVFIVIYQFQYKDVGLMVIACVRSVCDYWFGWNFYFPLTDQSNDSLTPDSETAGPKRDSGTA